MCAQALPLGVLVLYEQLPYFAGAAVESCKVSKYQPAILFVALRYEENSTRGAVNCLTEHRCFEIEGNLDNLKKYWKSI